MSKILQPIGYQSELNMKQTEQGIKLIKEFFQQNLRTAAESCDSSAVCAERPWHQ